VLYQIILFKKSDIFTLVRLTFGKQLSGVAGLFPVGEGVFSITNLQIGPDGSKVSPVWCKTDAEKLCPKSDLVVYPNENPVSVTFSVTETGKIGYNIDQNIAELNAIKEAIGPAIKDALKEGFK
jgi:hypothetical protein